MKTDRLNAFTDGVIAVIITIMVLDLKAPETADLAGLRGALPLLGLYVLSFGNVGIYWTNHHHMLNATRQVDGRVLWANLLLLFWLSLVPFAVRWLGEAGLKPLPTAGYGVVLLLSAIAYLLLERAIIAREGAESEVRRAVQHGWKEWLSITGYTSGLVVAFVAPLLSLLIYAATTGMWLVPDRRFERRSRG